MEYYTLKPQQPVGYLRQRALNTVIAVYHYIPPFQRWCMKVCFGLEYEDAEQMLVNLASQGERF